ncbi:hypothetical protein E4P41_06435 [Geodermatophilus sp. DF01-2]|uniref:hypothetical protein n=1 Tax=Geodermatophilus sp. DF01-2 TaxID=2559610 RepID=UPI0010739A01|nr:hypothetical protein [Geodermatophilus sp. DF01_2]TFV62714.1 hypothetical protein E4P41_06435 [Geodermatophilus sp. DF01_2]
MDAVLFRLPTGIGGWLALVNHALALGDLSEVDYLELKGSLSFAERQDRKRSAVVVSRAILGMANRMPDLAEKHLSGSGVVFVGIDQSQTLVGAESVDAAMLRDLIEPYVGEDGPTWDHQFINHPDGLVLAVIVDPPKWGDRIHACRKDYFDDTSKLAIRDGEVLVRVPGKTRPATSHDLANLERRRAKAPHTGAEVSVAYVGAFDRTSRANVRELIEGMVHAAADELIDGIPAPVRRSPYNSGMQAILEQTSGHGDRRSTQQFRDDVEQWQEDCREATEDVVTEFLRHTLDHGTFMIRNESDRYLESVRVQVSFPPSVSVLMASDTDYCDHGGQFRPLRMLPDPPAKYGDLRPYGLDYSGLIMPRVAPMPSLPAPDMDVEVTPAGYVVSWYVGDLPPRATVNADEEFAVFTDESLHVHNHRATEDDHEPMQSEIGGAWKVTARAVDHVFQGEVTVTCRQAPGALAIWRRGTSNDES